MAVNFGDSWSGLIDLSVCCSVLFAGDDEVVSVQICVRQPYRTTTDSPQDCRSKPLVAA
jgi:hypothetical protein